MDFRSGAVHTSCICCYKGEESLSHNTAFYSWRVQFWERLLISWIRFLVLIQRYIDHGTLFVHNKHPFPLPNLHNRKKLLQFLIKSYFIFRLSHRSIEPWTSFLNQILVFPHTFFSIFSLHSPLPFQIMIHSVIVYSSHYTVIGKLKWKLKKSKAAVDFFPPCPFNCQIDFSTCCIHTEYYLDKVCFGKGWRNGDVPKL